MLAVIAYHRAGKGKRANSIELLAEHFRYLKENYPILMPGEKLEKKRLNLSLTFDDATFDFYRFVFPLLKELSIKVLLGVPVGYIQDSTTVDSATRLSIPPSLAMQEGIFEKSVPFCTFEELKEMADSGHVEVACHSFAHGNLTLPFIKYDRELIQSKEILEKKVGKKVTSFIYPFGKQAPFLHEKVMENYSYAFRLGSRYNSSWNSKKRPLTRLIGDEMASADDLFTVKKRAFFFLKSLLP